LSSKDISVVGGKNASLGEMIREFLEANDLFLKGHFPEEVAKPIRNAYYELCKRYNKEKKMIYATGGTKTTKNIDTSKEEGRSLVLTDEEILRLARWAVVTEKHYETPVDIEWAKDGESGKLFIVQARPETVQS